MSLASLWSNEFWKHILFASIKQYTDRHNLELGGGGGNVNHVQKILSSQDLQVNFSYNIDTVNVSMLFA